MLRVQKESRKPYVRPLDEVTVSGADDGVVVVRDGSGVEYHRADARDPFRFHAAGALGTHTVLYLDRAGKLLDSAAFRLDCRTGIDDEGGRFRELLAILYHTMLESLSSGYEKNVRINGKQYKYYKVWLRDHVHALKGMKYFDDDLKTGIELYADWQRDDGMIWDNVKKQFHSNKQNNRDYWFAPGDFIRKVPGNPQRRFQRIPVENDVEFLFLEGLYYTWKATGDDAWMESILDNAIRACEYSTSDEYRWSQKFQLLKRGFTIDTWDFQAQPDLEITGHTMVVDPQKSHFGVMHGDNTGFAVGCRYLAEMLEYAGRAEEAERFRHLADDIMHRLNDVAWNGEFYTHHVSEDPEFERELDVDESKQVSLSNAYALNRRLPHPQCVAIIETYRRIREEMPASSPGEFYCIYPPFGHWRDEDTTWNYMNGGVTPICAGELAHGAFEHGYERYGVQILDTVRAWGEDHGDHVPCVLRGAMPEEPERSFQCLDLRAEANVDFHGKGADGVPGWAGDEQNDMRGIPTGRRSFQGIEFDVIDPAQNGRRACIGLSTREAYREQASVSCGEKCDSLYLLHALTGSGLAGRLTLHYADGETRTRYIEGGKQVGSWYMPPPPEPKSPRGPDTLVAWSGPNGKYENVGVYVHGLDNPRPDVELDRVEFTAAENGNIWFVIGATGSDAPTFLPVSDVSYGIPDIWGAAAVVYALIEGLAGVVDTGVAFDRAQVAPRWSAAGVDGAAVTVKYPASDGYVSYDYTTDGDDVMWLKVTGSGHRMNVRLLLPEGRAAAAVAVDGAGTEFEIVATEQSRYVSLTLKGPAAHTVRVDLR